MAAKAQVKLDGVSLMVDPEEIRWNFKMKAADSKTIGGKVIQIFGTRLDDITLRGATPGPEPWRSELALRDQVRKWADRAVNSDNATPLRFTYAPRGWELLVFVKSISGITWDETQPMSNWELVLHPIDESASDVVRGIKDLYIKRLMEGVGWKQTEYNGPTQSDVEAALGGLSVEQYVADQTGQAYEAGTRGEEFNFGGGLLP